MHDVVVALGLLLGIVAAAGAIWTAIDLARVILDRASTAWTARARRRPR